MNEFFQARAESHYNHLNSLLHLSIAFITVVSRYLIWDLVFENKFHPWNLSLILQTAILTTLFRRCPTLRNVTLKMTTSFLCYLMLLISLLKQICVFQLRWLRSTSIRFSLFKLFHTR